MEQYFSLIIFQYKSNFSINEQVLDCTLGLTLPKRQYLALCVVWSLNMVHACSHRFTSCLSSEIETFLALRHLPSYSSTHVRPPKDGAPQPQGRPARAGAQHAGLGGRARCTRWRHPWRHTAAWSPWLADWDTLFGRVLSRSSSHSRATSSCGTRPELPRTPGTCPTACRSPSASTRQTIPAVENPSSLNLAEISPSLYVCLSQTLIYFFMNEHIEIVDTSHTTPTLFYSFIDLTDNNRPIPLRHTML